MLLRIEIEVPDAAFEKYRAEYLKEKTLMAIVGFQRISFSRSRIKKLFRDRIVHLACDAIDKEWELGEK